VLAHYNYGNALFELGRFDDAIQQYAAALRLDPEQWEASINRGRALCARGRIEEAIGDFQRVLDRNPAHLSAAINLENALFQLGRIPEAAAMADRAMALAREQGDEPVVAQTAARLGSLRSRP